MKAKSTSILIMVLSCVALLNSQTAPVANPAAPAQPKAPAAVQANAPKQQTAAPKGKYFQAKVDLPANAPHDAASVVSSLGSPLPFQLAATPDGGSVLIYCTTSDVKKCDAKLLQKLEADIATLAGGGSFELIHFEHAAYVTGFVKEAQALKYRGITVEAAGGNAIRLPARTQSLTPITSGSKRPAATGLEVPAGSASQPRLLPSGVGRRHCFGRERRFQ